MGTSWKEWMYEYHYRKQTEYEAYWVKNLWGFGDRMRDYLLEGHRRIKLCC